MIGVLALQGAFARHCEVLISLGIATTQVRTPAQLEACAALILPGGESTTMSMLLERSDLFGPIQERIEGGMPVFGTCAGMILLATRVSDGREDQRNFAAISIGVRRNGYGRQIDSFESDILVAGLEAPFHAVFIRAPVVEDVSGEVEVLATLDERPVLLRQHNVMVSAFHPELTPDVRIHQLFLDSYALA